MSEAYLSDSVSSRLVELPDDVPAAVGHAAAGFTGGSLVDALGFKQAVSNVSTAIPLHVVTTSIGSSSDSAVVFLGRILSIL